ncbi:DUF7134 domain-containing protein [Actinoplanes sp. NPDC004185]
METEPWRGVGRPEAWSGAGVVLAQVLWWPLGPSWLGETVDAAALWPVTLLGFLAAAAVVVCRAVPVVALAAAVTSTVAGIALLGDGGVRPADAVAGPLAVVVTLFALTARVSRTASAVAACVVPVIFTVLMAGRGAPPRTALGIGLFLGAACALVWAVGLGHRSRRARRRAERTYQRSVTAVPEWMAAAERRRLAAELHDVAAHRLTGIAVAAAAGLRLGEPLRRAEAAAYAAEAGRQAVDELDQLVSLEQPGPDAEERIEELVAASGAGDFVRTGPRLHREAEAFAYAVVREALTNISRYASTAAVRVRVAADRDRLRIVVVDSGGAASVEGLGGGNGLAGLAARARTMGGTVTAAPYRTGWRVRADVPLPLPASDAALAGPRRGRTVVRDRALVVLAAGTSLSVVLLPAADDTDLLAQPGPAAFLLLALLAHASTVAWRRTRPARATTVAIAVLSVWITISAAWRGPESTSLFLGSWWIELVLVYSVAAYGAGGWRSWWAPAALATLGGTALAAAPGIEGSRPAAAAVLAGVVLAPATAVWGAGLLVRARRRRRADSAARSLMRERDRADDATRQARRQLAERLRGDARRRAREVVTAADATDLSGVVTAARAALTALREVVQAPPPDDREPPPGLAGLHALAARHRAACTVTGSPHAPSAAAEVVAYRTAAMLLGDGAQLLLELGTDGVDLTVRRGRSLDPPAVRRLRRLVTDADGNLAGDPGRGSVRVWLPNAPQ